MCEELRDRIRERCTALRRSVAVVSACPESARAMVTDRLDEFGGRGDEGAC